MKRDWIGQRLAYFGRLGIASVLLVLSVGAGVAQQAPAPESGSETMPASGPANEDALKYPGELDDPSISLEVLQLRLIPLTANELGALAAAWQERAHAATQAVVDKSLEIRAADPAVAQPLRIERLSLLEDRGTVFDKFAAVVSGFEAKGGDSAQAAAYRSYIEAVTIQETSRWTWREFADSALTWVFSRDGGGQLIFRIAVVAASFFGLLIAARIVRAWTRRVLQRVSHLSVLLRGFVVMTVYWLTLAFGLMIVLAFLGVNITPLFALFGGASFIIAFALQDTLGNLAAGLMIMINRPFDEGDFVSVGGVSGTVKSVSIVSTIVATPDNQMIVIPNSRVWGDVITNTSASEIRRVDLVFGISYDDSIEKAQSVIEDVVNKHPSILSDPAPVIRVNQLSASSVDFVCRPWVRSTDYLTTYWDLTRAVKEAFDAHGITIPFPQTDMHIHVADDGAGSRSEAASILSGQPRGQAGET